ncbi:hypothetical protein BGX38DRAFT_1235099 [Terfezia claveryi]|nr:hypothetical protein BGX38DRAFT_1235099 [Terfezia claveryi]
MNEGPLPFKLPLTMGIKGIPNDSATIISISCDSLEESQTTLRRLSYSMGFAKGIPNDSATIISITWDSPVESQTRSPLVNEP